MKKRMTKLAAAPIAHTPRYSRPELFGSCQLSRGNPYGAA
jgi:hypothetical protein